MKSSRETEHTPRIVGMCTSTVVDNDFQIVKELHKISKPRRVFDYYCNKIITQMINYVYSAQPLEIEPLDLGDGDRYTESDHLSWGKLWLMPLKPCSLGPHRLHATIVASGC